MAKQPFKDTASANAAAATDLRPKKPVRSLRYKILKWGGISTLGIAAAVGLTVLIYWRSLYVGMPSLPDSSELWAAGRKPAIEFVVADGTTIAVRGPRYGRVVDVASLPQHVTGAFIAAEDKRFYEHDGADTTAIARAAWMNWWSGKTVSGASTLTQQLIKNLVLSPKQTLRRKAQEVRLARELETRLSKDEILDLYLNRMYFGANFYGLDAAANGYFDKPPQDLTVGESALLASVLKAPSRMALNQNMTGALGRQDYVLARMVETGIITEAQRQTALGEEIAIAEPQPEDPSYGYIFDTVSSRIETMLPKVPADLVVTLTIEPETQSAVAKAIQDRIAADGEALKASQAAAVLMRPTGEVVAMVGGVDYETGKFNRAVQAKRQPGSSFKAFVYAAALEQGLFPFDVRSDEPIKIGKWEPKNYNSNEYLGPVTLSEAFARSLNTVAAQVGNEIGENRTVNLAKRFGIRSPLKPLPSIALGSQEVSLYELTRAFGTFSNMGKRLDPYMITAIEDSRGTLLYERPDYEPVEVYDEKLARQMNSMLARVVASGTGTKARIPGWTVAGKTGTSQDWRDGWFIGFTSQMIGGVWVGNDDDSSMARVTGGGLPAQLFSEVMTLSLAGDTPTPLEGAEGMLSPGKAAERRIAFYRNLSGAFRQVEQSAAN